MAGLTLDDSVQVGEVIKQADGHAVVTATLTSGAWGTYSVRPGTDVGWILYGPKGHAATISGLSSTPEDKTFTPDLPGRYLLVFEGYDGASQVQLSALYEVRAASAQESIFAPRETGLYDAAVGWHSALEERLHQLALHLRGACKLAVVVTDAFTTYSAGDRVVLYGYTRPFVAGAAGVPVLAAPDSVAVSVNPVFSPPASTDVVGLVLEDIAISSVGLVLVEGFVPYDTLGAGFSGFANVYVNDSGQLSSTPGSIIRKVGYCSVVGGGNADSSPVGTLYFNGHPEYSTALAPEDKFPFERTLLAGINSFAAGQHEIVAQDYTRPQDILNPSFSSSCRLSLSSVTLRVAGYVTDATEAYYVELYDDAAEVATPGSGLLCSVYVYDPDILEYTGYITLGSGANEMPESTAKAYSVRIRSASGNLDESKRLVLTNVALICVGGFV